MEHPKTATFIGINDRVQRGFELPAPASTEIPEWYRESTSYYNGNKMEFNHAGDPLSTVKQCMPVLDIISTGWIQKTWTDIIINTNEDGQVYFQHSLDPAPLSFRPLETIGKLPIPSDCHDIAFFWKRPWHLITPPGYSTLYTHPFYREDLPFKTVSAVVDTDNYHNEGKVACFIKKGFTGLIPKGTPMYQIIPFKKESWVANRGERDEEFFTKTAEEMVATRGVFSGGYKKEYWTKPDFSNTPEDKEVE
jgi:hypothetical protein